MGFEGGESLFGKAIPAAQNEAGTGKTQLRYTALRWKVVFLVPANESFALNDAAEAPGRGFAPLLTWAAFSRAACNFWAARPIPPIFTPPALGMKSLIQNFLTLCEAKHKILLFRRLPANVGYSE
jgi:hypothetical protein